MFSTPQAEALVEAMANEYVEHHYLTVGIRNAGCTGCDWVGPSEEYELHVSRAVLRKALDARAEVPCETCGGTGMTGDYFCIAHCDEGTAQGPRLIETLLFTRLGTVQDAGGGMADIWVDRDLANYPQPGTAVFVERQETGE